MKTQQKRTAASTPPNRPRALRQAPAEVLLQKSAASINGGPDEDVLQMFRCGLEPKNPNNYRNHTDLASDGSGAPDASKQFNGSQRAAVLSNNENRSISSAVNISVVAKNKSDHSSGLLGDRDQITMIEPEVDHIVPKHIGGANTYDNARVLSKQENDNDSLVNRPGASDRKLVAFEGFNVGIYNPQTGTGNWLGSVSAWSEIPTVHGLNMDRVRSGQQYDTVYGRIVLDKP